MRHGDSVVFANKASSMMPGAIAGAAIAIGVPAVTLIWGKNLSEPTQMWMAIIGVGVGGLIALTATFFGLAMPSSVNQGGCACECVEEKSREEKSA